MNKACDDSSIFTYILSIEKYDEIKYYRKDVSKYILIRNNSLSWRNIWQTNNTDLV